MGCAAATGPARAPGGGAARREGEPGAPRLEAVDVPEMAQAKWEENGGRELDPVLAIEAVVLLDGKWVVERAGSGGTAEPRQLLPPAAFLSHGGVRALRAVVPEKSTMLRIVCVSHCWLQADHPDPRGHNLRILGRALGLLSRDPHQGFQGPFATFLDFCCLHQNCRDRDGIPQRRTFEYIDGAGRFADGAVGRFDNENVLFRTALGSLGSFYSHPRTLVFMLTAFPSDYDNPDLYTRSGNTHPYSNRGWCFCESSWAMLTKPSFALVDLGRTTGKEDCYFKRAGVASSLVATCAAGHRAPIFPDAFEAELGSKGFTNGRADRPRVATLYREAFAHRFESTTRLAYTQLDWGHEEVKQMCAVLASGAAPQLERLQLSINRMGDEGVSCVVEWLLSPGAAQQLQWLSLDRNLAGGGGAALLAGALRDPGVAPRLQRLNLQGNPLGAEGRSALEAAWAAASRPEGGLLL